jgi:hypothetical protein
MEARWITVFIGRRAPSSILRALFSVFRDKVCRDGAQVVVTTVELYKGREIGGIWWMYY